MKFVKIFLLVDVILVAAYLLLAPIGPAPGFFIGGEPASAPATWPDTSQLDEVRLKVPGTVPWVVIIWVVERDSDLYVVGSGDSFWTRQLGDGGPVELRMEDHTYALNAVRVRDGLEGILSAYVSKYEADYPEIVGGFPPLDQFAAGGAVFRLDRR